MRVRKSRTFGGHEKRNQLRVVIVSCTSLSSPLFLLLLMLIVWTQDEYVDIAEVGSCSVFSSPLMKIARAFARPAGTKGAAFSLCFTLYYVYHSIVY